MALPLATLYDLNVRLATAVEPSEESRAEAFLADASALVRAEAGRSWSDPESAPGIARAITVQVVERRLSTKHLGVIQQATGPLSHTRSSRAAEGLYLTTQEKDLIAKAVHAEAAEFGGLHTIGTTRGDLEIALQSQPIYDPRYPETT